MGCPGGKVRERREQEELVESYPDANGCDYVLTMRRRILGGWRILEGKGGWYKVSSVQAVARKYEPDRCFRSRVAL
jgi:hypothetical protein